MATWANRRRGITDHAAAATMRAHLSNADKRTNKHAPQSPIRGVRGAVRRV